MNKKIFLTGVLLSSSLLFGFDSKAASIGESISESVDNYICCYEPVKIVKAEPLEPVYSKEDIELLALVTMAEAEGEPEEGKRLVIDTILNRVDHGYFPDTISEVIYQKGQFTSMWNGRSNRCYVSDDICRLVNEEIESRTNSEVIYFHAGVYPSYGSPITQVGNHYFSSYD